MATTLASPAFAGDVLGEWARGDGQGRVRFAPCGGGAVCGVVTWVKDPKAPGKVGEKVFYEMRPSGDNAWSGKAFNPDDGKEYTGKMTLDGDRLRTAGCVFAGLVCKSFDWKRVQ